MTLVDKLLKHLDDSVANEISYSVEEEEEEESYDTDTEYVEDMNTMDTNNAYFKKIPSIIYENESLSLQNYYKAIHSANDYLYNSSNEWFSPSIYINKENRGVSMNTNNDVFIVKKSMDYIYSYILDEVNYHILFNHEKTELSKKRLKKMEKTVFCYDEHEKCPLESIIYTKKTSLFYLFCLSKIEKMNEFNFNIDIEELCPHLVYFLCYQPHDEDEHIVPMTISKKKIDTTGWVSLPISYLLLWYSK